MDWTPFSCVCSSSYFRLYLYIFNLSVLSCRIPRVWKTAHVIPLHKGGEATELNNYRPISKLSCLAKSLESLVNSQLKSFLNENSILSNYQSGFREGHSTISAVTLVLNDLYSDCIQKKHCAAVFIDLTKAFDTVGHTLLLRNLKKIGFDAKALEWSQNYLTDRQQCTAFNNYESDFLAISKGVSQGSILGPVLFNIYINDIAASVSSLDCKIHLYADDTILYCSADSIHAAVIKLQNSFNALQIALNNHKLVLNAKKTKLMLFSRSLNSDVNCVNFTTLAGSTIERVTEYKYLGIWLDETFKPHINKLVSKCRQKLGYLYRNKACFPMHARKTIVEATLLSVLDYGDVIYKYESASSLKLLDPVYHSALRFITGDPYRTHHCDLYRKVGWPPLAARREMHWLILIYKTLSGHMPEYITSLINFNNSNYQTRSSGWISCQVPRVFTELGKS
uniref:Reverse transcriptase domain-containing protein n=1 Tax=Astyanax mexicanus TaxID=7994 RepID=A0A3B1IPA0_ASTMX